MAVSLAGVFRAQLDAKRSERDALLSVDSAEFTPESEARAVALNDEIRSLTEKIADAQAAEKRETEARELEQRVDHAPAVVVKEERTYTAEKSAVGSTSFFRDAYAAQAGDYDARGRLERHAREVAVEGEGVQTRATGTSSFAGLIVPQYLVNQAALIARAGRPFANTVQKLQIPDQGTQFQIPRGTTGASAAVQATENSGASSTDEVWGNVTVPVATIAGQQDVSRQSLERGTPGLDALIYLDLAGAYAVTLDGQMLSGTGTSGQMLGALSTAGINQATAFTAAATATTFYSKVAGQLNAVETTRFLAPDTIAMHPRRWNWLLNQVDSAGRPLVVPNPSSAFNALGVSTEPIDTPSSSPVGSFLGLPVITDASIPTAVGTGPEDQVIVYRRSDLLLWEDGDGAPRQLRFEQTLGNQLTVKLVAYGYAAFTAGRYPTAVGVVGGNAGTAGFGLIAPTF